MEQRFLNLYNSLNPKAQEYLNEAIIFLGPNFELTINQVAPESELKTKLAMISLMKSNYPQISLAQAATLSNFYLRYSRIILKSKLRNEEI